MAGKTIKAYFSRQLPFYLYPMGTNTDLTFDAAVVDVPQKALNRAMELRAIVDEMKAGFDEHSAYEEAAQEEADMFVSLLAMV